MRLVGHRGDPRHAPENTLASLEMAWRHGRRAVECDVRASRDGVPVLCHDATLDRVTALRGLVARRSWAVLRGHLPSVADALTAFRRRPMTVFLDVKVPGIERRLHRVIRASGVLRRCRVASAHARVLRLFRRLTPAVLLYRVTGYHQPLTPRVIAASRRLGVRGLVAYTRWVTPSAARRLAEASLELYVWTVRRREEARRFRRLGVTGIMTEQCPH